MGAENEATCNAQHPDPASLKDAFERLHEASVTLADSYHHLEKRVADLAAELELTRRDRVQQYAEKERLAGRLENLLNALPAGVIVLDGEGRVRDSNPAAVELLGALAAGAVWRDVVSRAFAPRWDDGHDITLKSGRRVNISTQALQGEAGQILLLKDVTETRRLQEQLSRHRRLASMGEMAATLAHQVRTPLASAILYLSNLRLANVDEELRKHFHRQALERLQHLERLVADMLLFARGGAFDAADFTVSSLLESLRADQPGTREAGGFDVRIIDESRGAVVRGNRDALVSALRNLADNAAEACGHRGQLLIHATLEPDAVVALRFSDNGPGVPEEVRESIFEPFFTTRTRGSGLGLAVTQAVVRAHGGDIALESSGQHGTTFSVRLPWMELPESAETGGRQAILAALPGPAVAVPEAALSA